MRSRFDGHPLFRTDTFRQLVTNPVHQERWDDGYTAMAIRMLEEVDQELILVEYQDLKYQDYFTPKNYDVGAETHTYRFFDSSGKAQFAGRLSEDVPTVEVKGQEVTAGFRDIVMGYEYDVNELARVAFARKNGFKLELDTIKAQGARRAIEELCDTTASTGTSGTGATTSVLYGINNHPGVPSPIAAGGTWQGYVATDITNSTNLAPQKIIADINKVKADFFTQSKGKLSLDLIALPTVAYSTLNSVARSPQYTDDTLLDYVRKQFPGVAIDFWPLLDTAAVSGTNGRALFMSKQAGVCNWIVGQETIPQSPFQKNLAFVFPLYKRIGGIQVRKPLGVRYLDGVC